MRAERSTAIALSLGWGLLLVAGCGEDTLNSIPHKQDDANSGVACESVGDCATGEACVDGICAPDAPVDDPIDDPVDDPPVDDPVDDPTDDPPPEDPPVDDPPPDDPPPDDPPPDDPPPDDPPVDPTEVMHVGGLWDTVYHLDWSAYVGPLADLGTPLDFLDQILLDNIDLPLIDDIIDTYVPDWIGDLVHILNGMVHFFQDVRVEARMDLTHVMGDPSQVTGLEAWDVAYVQVIDQCPYGEMDAGYPACADLAIPLNVSQTSVGTISAMAQPFSGWFGDVGGGVYELQINDREVQMELGQFLMFVLNTVVNLATNGQFPTLNAALASMVDCAAVQTSIEGLFGQPMPWVGPACTGAVDDVIDELTNAINSVTVDWEVLELDQSAVAYDDDADGSADRLGAPPSAPGAVDGDFTLVYSVSSDGTWSGTRP